MKEDGHDVDRAFILSVLAGESNLASIINKKVAGDCVKAYALSVHARQKIEEMKDSLGESYGTLISITGDCIKEMEEQLRIHGMLDIGLKYLGKLTGK